MPEKAQHPVVRVGLHSPPYGIMGFMKDIGRGALLALVLATSACGRGPAPPPWPPPLLAPNGSAKAITESLKVQMPAMLERAAVPGLALAVLADGVVWSGGFGVADDSARRPVDAQTIFEAASLGKPVLAAIALRLVEDGKLDLDRPIARDYQDPELAKDPLYPRITLRQLLSHTSGLANLRRGQPNVVHFPPGDHFSYSGVGFLTAQRLIEKVTKQPFDAVAARLVFEPAGMTNSSFVWQTRFEDHTAVGHDENGHSTQKRRPSVPFAPASLHTTAEDYGRFMAALVDGKLIHQPRVAEFWTEQVAVTPTCVECPGAVGPERSSRVFWGLGWGIDRTPDGPAIWQWGDNEVFRSYAVLWPAKRAGLVYFTNSVNGLALRNDLVSHVLGGEHPDWEFVKYDQYDAPNVLAMKSVQAAFAKDPSAGAAEYRRQKALGHAPTDETALDLLGFKFFTQHHTKTAIAVWELEVQEFPKSWHGYDSLGLAYRVTGEPERSIASYRKALAINPADEDAKKALAGGR